MDGKGRHRGGGRRRPRSRSNSSRGSDASRSSSASGDSPRRRRRRGSRRSRSRPRRVDAGVISSSSSGGYSDSRSYTDSSSYYSGSSSCSSCSDDDDRRPRRGRGATREDRTRRSDARSGAPFQAPERGLLDDHHGGGGLLDSSGDWGILAATAPPRPPKSAEELSDSSSDDRALPFTDWMCSVCSNPNSVSRSVCFRCRSSYGRSTSASASSEVVVRRAVVDVAGGAAKAEAAVREALAAGGQPEAAAVVDVATRGRSVYVRLPSIEAARRLLLHFRCRLRVGAAEDGCAMGFSKRMVTAPPPLEEEAIAAGKGILEEAGDAEGPGSGVSPVAEEAVDPLLAAVPRDLWPKDWSPPESFATAEEERAYLSRLSDHWKSLSTAQRQFYDDGVKRALARKKDEEAAEAERAAAATSAQPLASPPSSSSSSPASLPGGTSSSVSDLKRRLAERKAAMGKGTPTSSPSVTPTAAPVVVASDRGGSSSAIDKLKQRIANQKALAAATSTASAEAGGKSKSSSPPSPSKACDGAGAMPAVPTVHGFPLPPGGALPPQSSSGVTVLADIPWEVAARVVPSALLHVATSMWTPQL